MSCCICIYDIMMLIRLLVWCVFCIVCFACLTDLNHLHLFHQSLEHVDGQREDDGGVLLSRDGVESLEVPQLEGCRGLNHHIGSFLQGTGCLLLSLSGNHLCSLEDVWCEEYKEFIEDKILFPLNKDRHYLTTYEENLVLSCDLDTLLQMPIL